MSILKIIKSTDFQTWQKTGYRYNLLAALTYVDNFPAFSFKDAGNIINFNAQKIRQNGISTDVLSTTSLSIALLTSDAGFIYRNESVNNYIEAGLYQFTITTSNGNYISEPFFITTYETPPVAPLNVLFEKTDETSLNGNDGTITITAEDGTPPYEYSINNGVSFQSSGNYINLFPDTYNCICKDSQNNEVTDSLTIEQFVVALSAQFNHTNETSKDVGDGTITMIPSGGVAPYEYSINNGVDYYSTNVFTGLADDTYICKVRDSELTVVSDSVIIEAGAPIQSFSMDVTGVNGLEGIEQGYIMFGALYSPVVTPVTYSIDNGETYQADGWFPNLSTGIYKALVKDADNKYSQVETIEITEIDVTTGGTSVGETVRTVNGWSVVASTGGATATDTGTATKIEVTNDGDSLTFSKSNVLSAYQGQSKKVSIVLKFNDVSANGIITNSTMELGEISLNSLVFRPLIWRDWGVDTLIINKTTSTLIASAVNDDLYIFLEQEIGSVATYIEYKSITLYIYD